MDLAKPPPNLHKLFLLSDQLHPDNYFRQVGNLIFDESYQRIDRRLGLLDAAALDDMLRRATPKVTFRDRKRNRDWAALIDVLNEAKGYEYLVSRGYSHIRYLPNSNVAQSPDLLAESPEPGALLEVKSIHQSDCDIAQLGKIRSAAYQISDGLKRKIVSDYKKAIDQCAEVDPSKTRKWFLFLCIDVDSDIACVPSNIPDLDRFIKEMSTDQCEIAYESGIWG